MSQQERKGELYNFQPWAVDWDRYLNVYNITELPSIPLDADAEDETIPIAIQVMREYFLNAARKFASEVWFDFEPSAAGGGFINACYSVPGKITTALLIPKDLFYQDDNQLGIFGTLYDQYTDEGMFSIHISKFEDKPKYDPFDRRGRIIQPVLPPDHPDHDPSGFPSEDHGLKTRSSCTEDEDEFPGLREVVTIHAFRVSLKGRTVPDDLVVQVCPRFWYMPTGFEVG